MTILPNGVAVIDGDTHHRVWIEQCGSLIHDRWMADSICRHIKPGDVVVDGGANIGTLTLPMLEAGAFVWAFEPNNDAHSCLIHNCISRSDRLRAIPAGLGDGWSVATMHQEQNAGASWVGEKQEGGAIAIVTDLDHYSLRPSVIKLDVEGYEVKALTGARRTIERKRPALFVEVNRAALERAGASEDELLFLIESLGYRWSILQPQCNRGDEQYDIEALPI